MKNIVALALVAIFSSAISLAQVSVTGFGTGDYNDLGSTGFSQTSTTATFVGNDLTGTFAGTFAANKNLTNFTSGVLLTGTLSGANPNSPFTIQLLDSGFTNYVEFSGNWSSFVSGASTTVRLPFVRSIAGVNLTSIAGINIGFGGAGSSLNFTFDNLSAIPEPSTYAALVGIAVLGFVATRRKMVR